MPPKYVKQPTDYVKKGALRAIEPAIAFLARNNVSPNTITTVGTLITVAAGIVYATGHIMTAGWIMNVTAFFDVADGEVARRTGRSTVFGAFYDSTLDRVADGALLGGLAVFFARNNVLHGVPTEAGTPMVAVTILGIVGTFLTSYTRARAEALGIDAKVGFIQRPERVTLLSAPQAAFGLALGGWVLIVIVVLLSVTAWITAVQRIIFVYHATHDAPLAQPGDVAAAPRDAQRGPAPPANERTRGQGEVSPRAKVGKAA